MAAKDCEQVLFVTFEKDGIYQIQCSGLVPGPGHVYCTLIIGEDSCLLVDNGFGDDDFTDWPPELCPLMAGKKLICAATHGHLDHIGGADQFDELYLSPDDYGLLPAHANGKYDASAGTIGKCRLLPLADGQRFELGGRAVAAIHTPGHTWGSFSFYDEKAKIMLTGDTLNRHVFLQCVKPAVPFKTYLASLERLLEYDFDIFLGGHHPEAFDRKWIPKMEELVRGFDINKAHRYIREGVPESIYMCSEGRGYGDPNYIAFMFDRNDLPELLS